MPRKTDNRRQTGSGVDKTSADEGRRSNGALLARINELSDFYDFSPVGYISLDSKGRLLDINLTAGMMFKSVRSELTGQSLFDFVKGDDRDSLHLHLRRLFKEQKPQSCELRIQNNHDETVHVVLDSIYIEDRHGHPVCRSVLVDITERIRAEKTLLDSEERLRMVVDGARLGTWDHNLMTGEINWNPRLYELLGRDPHGPEITGETFFDYIHPEDRARVVDHAERWLREEDLFEDEFRVVRDDGEVRWIGGTGYAYRDETGRPVRVAGVNYDINKRKTLEEELRSSRDELDLRVQERTADLKVLSQRLLEAQESERRHVALELHDGIGGRLTAVKMALEAKLNKIRKGETVSESALGEILELVRTCMSETRRMQHNLRPATLDHLGLAAALRGLCRELGETNDGMTATARILGIDAALVPEELKITIFRISQEALTNAIKHSGAKKVELSLTHRDGAIQLMIRDDGRGFETEKAFSPQMIKRGIGLASMRERCNLSGGSFSIDSRAGEGTTIGCSWGGGISLTEVQKHGNPTSGGFFQEDWQ